jgi:hypothetical protein
VRSLHRQHNGDSTSILRRDPYAPRWRGGEGWCKDEGWWTHVCLWVGPTMCSTCRLVSTWHNFVCHFRTPKREGRWRDGFECAARNECEMARTCVRRRGDRRNTRAPPRNRVVGGVADRGVGSQWYFFENHAITYQLIVGEVTFSKSCNFWRSGCESVPLPRGFW